MIPNPWLLLTLAVALAASHGFVWFNGNSAGKRDVYAEWSASTNKATDKKLDVKEKQDAIQNAPVDSVITARRLLTGTF
jgi:hypothetical protein